MFELSVIVFRVSLNSNLLSSHCRVFFALTFSLLRKSMYLRESAIKFILAFKVLIVIDVIVFCSYSIFLLVILILLVTKVILKKAELKKCKLMRHDPEFLLECVLLRIKSKAAYKNPRNNLLPFPSAETIRRLFSLSTALLASIVLRSYISSILIHTKIPPIETKSYSF